MTCEECDALALKRDLLWRAYSDAVAVLNAAYTPADAGALTKLRAKTDEARIGFNLAETKFRQHQDSHVLPNGR